MDTPYKLDILPPSPAEKAFSSSHRFCHLGSMDAKSYFISWHFLAFYNQSSSLYWKCFQIASKIRTGLARKRVLSSLLTFPLKSAKVADTKERGLYAQAHRLWIRLLPLLL